MAQETRKDARAKIVSLNVRYKSATVDEFIENHSYDVSKGGVFIKTATPFAPGTLLKFEIRIAGDLAVIGGVGRVVWKREGAQTSGESPAGMGVKFIKLDDASRATIDRLVQVKGDTRSAYDEGVPSNTVPPPATTASTGAAVLDAPPPSVAQVPGAVVAAAARKATIVGVGSFGSDLGSAPPPALDAPVASPVAKAESVAPPAAEPPVDKPAPAAPPAATSFFPKTNSRGDMPPIQERTVMKQAAELLEEALKGAGEADDPLYGLGGAGKPETSLAELVSGGESAKPAAPEPEPAPAPKPVPLPVEIAPREPEILRAATPVAAPAAPAKKNGWLVPVVLGVTAVIGYVVYSQLSGAPASPDTPPLPPVPSAAPSAAVAPPRPSATEPVPSAVAPPSPPVPSAAPSASSGTNETAPSASVRATTAAAPSSPPAPRPAAAPQAVQVARPAAPAAPRPPVAEAPAPAAASAVVAAPTAAVAAPTAASAPTPVVAPTPVAAPTPAPAPAASGTADTPTH